ncbi:glycosyltransferase [Arthrobacter sp. C9C5]|uniref:glycosyltransferase family A protein n=1 Tax=Arthrobacter sp. C9C5 TaxID=2735267 RepID=UPI001584F40F|nr:glycosyltransferase [Arthrobacter sp. C9C5]NUU31084.1 glycosyltransferase [Arthrobacter sp. C9C5]
MSQSIEVVIPVHDPARPVARGMASVIEQRQALADRGVDLHVTVVLHNLAADSLSAPEVPAGFPAAAAGVRYLSYSDGVPSPAGPRNFALQRSDADYLSFLDSDDYLEPGSLPAWWEIAEKHGAAAVIAPLRTPAGSILASPRIRPSKPRVLDPLRDGLAYRSVPYGLLRRESLLDLGFSYTEGILTGEDLEPTLRLWFRSGAVCYPYGAPAYHQTDDSGPARVTSQIRPLREEFAWLEHLLAADWLRAASTPERRAIAHKILRVHGIGALLRRADAPDASGRAPLWDVNESLYWRDVTDRVLALAGGSIPSISRRDATLVQAAGSTGELRQLRALVAGYRGSGRAGALLTPRLRDSLSPDSAFRHYVSERLRARTGVFAAHPAAIPPAT